MSFLKPRGLLQSVQGATDVADCPWADLRRGAHAERSTSFLTSRGWGSSNADFSVEGAGGMEGTGASGHAQT